MTNRTEIETNAKESTLAHLSETAKRAFYWQSHSPDKRGERTVQEYSAELDSDLQQITAHATTEESKAKLPETLERYKSKYEKLLSSWLHSESNCASSFITGGSNFPVARMQKRRNWAEGHYQEFTEWRAKALKAIARDLKEPVDELEMNRKKLATEEETHALMVQANKIIRKGENITGQLQALGWNQSTINKVLTPDFANRIGFAAYVLQNSNARIKQYKARIEVLEQKQVNLTNENTEFEFSAGRVVLNFQADRVQILYNEKPAPEIISNLKSNGFRWSPSNKAWQRQLTEAGKYATQKITGAQIFKQAA